MWRIVVATISSCLRNRVTGLAAEEWRPARDSDSYAIDAVRAIVDSVLGGRARDLGDLTIHTTLDGVAQKAKLVAEAVKRWQFGELSLSNGGRISRFV